MAPDNRHLLEELGWITCVAWKKQQKEEKEIKKTKAQRTEDKPSMTRTSLDLAGLLIPIDKIVQREESGKSIDFEEGK